MTITLQELDIMSSKEYATKMTDPAFRAEVEALLQLPPKNPVAAVEPTGEVAPVVAAVVPPVVAELPELIYRWQPTDENDRPLGGVQVIKYRTESEKFDKLQAAQNELIRHLRKTNRDRVLGVEEKVPDDAEKFQNVTEFKPRELSSEARFKLAADLANPETFDAARDTLIESAFGAKPSVLASTLNDLQRRDIQARAVENYIEFAVANDLYDTMNNRQVLTSWVGKRNLAPTVANFNLALSQCRLSGLIDDAPAVQQVTQPTAEVIPPVVPVATVPNPQTPVAVTPALETPQPQAKRPHSHVPSGLNASVASAAGPALPSAAGTSVTLESIDKMSGDTFKQWIKDPANRRLHDQLENEAATRRRARHLGQ